MQRKHHQVLLQTSNKTIPCVEGSLQSAIQLDERQQICVNHTNSNAGDTKPEGHTGHFPMLEGGTYEVTYQNVTRGTAAEEVVYTNVI